MDGHEFERFISKLFKAKGYSTTVTSGSHDQGADVIANLLGEKIGIQAKRYSSPVSNKAIQEIVGAKNLYQLTTLMVITNNQFTKSAIELGKANNVIMWNREKLKQEIFHNAHLLDK